MSKYDVTGKNRVKRIPKRASYVREEIHEILDVGFICHVAFQSEGQVFVIPTAYGRKDDDIFLHGSSKSRLMQHIADGNEVSICVTHLDGIVLARSLFHSSMNYRSVVLFGSGKLTEGKEKLDALKYISDQIIKDRWKEARLPNDLEMKATSVVRISIDAASAKVRTGGPIDEKADYDLPFWAGEIPIQMRFGIPIPDENLSADISIPSSINSL